MQNITLLKRQGKIVSYSILTRKSHGINRSKIIQNAPHLDFVCEENSTSTKTKVTQSCHLYQQISHNPSCIIPTIRPLARTQSQEASVSGE